MSGNEVAKSVGINVNVSEESTKRVIDAVLDIFSPITESLGALGDHVRIYRATSVLRTLERAKEIAEDENLTLELPPPKFLVPYLEAASLEDEEDVGLQEKWARLLTNAGGRPDGITYFARTVLQELSSEEAKVLDGVVGLSKALTFSSFDEYVNNLQRVLPTAMAQAGDVITQCEHGSLSVDDARRRVVQILNGSYGVVPVGFRFDTKFGDFRPRNGFGEFYNPSFDNQYHSFLILSGRKIVDQSTYLPMEGELGRRIMGIEHVALTKLGFGVVKKLYGRQRLA